MLKEIPGVESANVDFPTKTATVECSSAVTAEQVTEVIAKSGEFTVTPKN